MIDSHSFYFQKFRNFLKKSAKKFPGHRLKICFCIPASPTDGFYSQIAMFRLALDRLGEVYKQANIMVTIGGSDVGTLPKRWKPYLKKNVKLHWVGSELYQKYGDFAQGNARFLQDYSAYDVVIFCDADTLPLKPIDDLLIRIQNYHEVMGVIAHYTFPHSPGENVEEIWRMLASQFVEKPIEFSFRHTLVSDTNFPEFPNSPFYVNFGFVVMTPEIIRTICDTYLKIRPNLIPILKNPRFTGQIALTLSLLAHDIPTNALGLRYNFPNDIIAEKLHAEEMKDIRIMHYLRTDKFNRQRIFANKDSFEKFLLLELDGSNKIFQNYIKKLTSGKYPFSF